MLLFVCVCVFVFKRFKCKTHVRPAERVRLGQLEYARRVLFGRREASGEKKPVPLLLAALGLLRLQVVVDLVRVHGPLGEHTATALDALLLRAPTRDAALAHA